MKNGPPPTAEPSVHNDDNEDDGGDGPGDGCWNYPGDDFNYGRSGPPWIQRDGNHAADGSDHGATNEDWGTSGDDAYNAADAEEECFHEDSDDNEHDHDDRDSYWSGQYSDREDEGYAHDRLPDNTVEVDWNVMEPRAGWSDDEGHLPGAFPVTSEDESAAVALSIDEAHEANNSKQDVG